jgi:hypothetical protein
METARTAAAAAAGTAQQKELQTRSPGDQFCCHTGGFNTVAEKNTHVSLYNEAR